MLTQDLIVFITGAGQGIGRATAVTFAREGASAVIAADLDECKAKETAALVDAFPNTTGFGLGLDVSNSAAVSSAVRCMIERYSRIDVLVNNAGICQDKTPFAEITAANWHLVYDVNVVGAANCVAAVIPFMKSRKSGSIVNLASMAGTTGGQAVSATYACSKAAVICMTKGTAKEYAAFGIRVNAVAPGLIRTPMTAGLDYGNTTIPLGRMGEPEDVAKVIAFLASDHAGYVTGCTIDVNGGLQMR
jgi:3-oxoacyl-[acyl-carrier protein] reductase